MKCPNNHLKKNKTILFPLDVCQIHLGSACSSASHKTIDGKLGTISVSRFLVSSVGKGADSLVLRKIRVFVTLNLSGTAVSNGSLISLASQSLSVIGPHLSMMDCSRCAGPCHVATEHLSVAYPVVSSIHTRHDLALKIGTSRPDRSSCFNISTLW